MKTLITIVLATFLYSGVSFAHDSTQTDNGKSVKSVEVKKPKKKKIEMCSECGKPESECECHNEKK